MCTAAVCRPMTGPLSNSDRYLLLIAVIDLPVQVCTSSAHAQGPWATFITPAFLFSILPSEDNFKVPMQACASSACPSRLIQYSAQSCAACPMLQDLPCLGLCMQRTPSKAEAASY